MAIRPVSSMSLSNCTLDPTSLHGPFFTHPCLFPAFSITPPPPPPSPAPSSSSSIAPPRPPATPQQTLNFIRKSKVFQQSVVRDGVEYFPSRPCLGATRSRVFHSALFLGTIMPWPRSVGTHSSCGTPASSRATRAPYPCESPSSAPLTAFHRPPLLAFVRCAADMPLDQAIAVSSRAVIVAMLSAFMEVDPDGPLQRALVDPARRGPVDGMVLPEVVPSPSPAIPKPTWGRPCPPLFDSRCANARVSGCEGGGGELCVAHRTCCSRFACLPASPFIQISTASVPGTPLPPPPLLSCAPLNPRSPLGLRQRPAAPPSLPDATASPQLQPPPLPARALPPTPPPAAPASLSDSASVAPPPTPPTRRGAVAATILATVSASTPPLPPPPLPSASSSAGGEDTAVAVIPVPPPPVPPHSAQAAGIPLVPPPLPQRGNSVIAPSPGAVATAAPSPGDPAAGAQRALADAVTPGAAASGCSEGEGSCLDEAAVSGDDDSRSESTGGDGAESDDGVESTGGEVPTAPAPVAMAASAGRADAIADTTEGLIPPPLPPRRTTLPDLSALAPHAEANASIPAATLTAAVAGVVDTSLNRTLLVKDDLAPEPASTAEDEVSRPGSSSPASPPPPPAGEAETAPAMPDDVALIPAASGDEARDGGHSDAVPTPAVTGATASSTSPPPPPVDNAPVDALAATFVALPPPPPPPPATATVPATSTNPFDEDVSPGVSPRSGGLPRLPPLPVSRRSTGATTSLVSPSSRTNSAGTTVAVAPAVATPPPPPRTSMSGRPAPPPRSTAKSTTPSNSANDLQQLPQQ